MTVARVFVAGAGLMGHGIAQVHAAIGCAVSLYEPELGRAEAGLERIRGNLERSVAKGRLGADAADGTLARIAATDDLGAVSAVDLVVEAVFEDLAVKLDLWRAIGALATDGAVLASNTSSISIDTLAAAVPPPHRPRFVGMHFFSPVPVMPLIELVRGSATDDDTERTIRELAAAMDKQVIVSADRPGFIVNRVLMPFIAEAIHALAEGVATREDIDAGARVGLNHPMGPLELADFIGLDVVLGIMRVLHDGLGGEHRRPPAMLVELVAAGRLGQKRRAGFYDYPR